MPPFRVETFRGEAAEWDVLVQQYGCVYQGYSFGTTLHDGLGQCVLRICAREGNEIAGHLTLACIHNPITGKAAISLPVCDEAGICSAGAGVTRAIVGWLNEFRDENSLTFVELRQFSARELGIRSDLVEGEPRTTLVLDLPDSQDIAWGTLHFKVRNRYRKGERAGLTYMCGGAELLSSFFDIYVENMRDIGVPGYPLRFFRALLEHSSGSAVVHIASRDGAAVAAAITLADGQNQRLPFAASYRWARSLAPNVFLYWNVICTSIRRNSRSIDFGRCEPDSGVYRFKKQFGATPRSLPRFYVLAPGVSPPQSLSGSGKFGVARRLWRLFPVAVTKWLGPLISRRLP